MDCQLARRTCITVSLSYPETNLLFRGIFILAYIMPNYTRLGRSLYAGRKPEGTQIGLNVERIKLLRLPGGLSGCDRLFDRYGA
jgi:ribose/xylose/arabinose/galactoside ABC-type transport system permease subunit